MVVEVVLFISHETNYFQWLFIKLWSWMSAEKNSLPSDPSDGQYHQTSFGDIKIKFRLFIPIPLQSNQPAAPTTVEQMMIFHN